MREFGILMIVFGILVFLSRLYLFSGKKRDFTKVLLWKNNVDKMTGKEISYVGKVVMFVSLSLIISGIIAILLTESFIPIIVLFITFILLLIIGMKIFK